MKKLMLLLLGCALCMPALAEEEKPKPVVRVGVFSTTTDWEAVTGLRLREYRGKFVADKKLVANGLELYYLDTFPCYGLGAGVRVWLGNGKQDGDLRIACIYPPQEIEFAWRNASRDADEGRTVGMLKCPVKDQGDLIIDLSKCEKTLNWEDMR